jgi:hypothetical protein
MSGLVLAGFSALNEESSSSTSSTGSSVQAVDAAKTSEESAEFDLAELQELDPRAEEEATHLTFNEALILYGREDFEAAERLFHDVLDSKFLAYCKHYGAKGGGIERDRVEIETKLRYNALKYLGFCRGQHHHDFGGALGFFGRAAEIDNTDVQMLFKYGIYALKDDRGFGPNYHLARAAFEYVLRQAPDHRPSLECLMSITFKLGDQFSCEDYVSQVLYLNPGHEKALRLKARCEAGEAVHQPDVFMGQPDVPIHDDDRVVVVAVDVMSMKGLLDSVTRTYRATVHEDLLNPCKLEEELMETTAALEVSVQNVVNEIVDLVSERHEIVKAIAQSIIDEIIDQNIASTDDQFVSSILDDVIGEVVAIGVVGDPEAKAELLPSAAVKVACTNKAKSFLDAVPIDLIEKRRSSRVRGAAEIFNDDTYSQVEAEMTARSLLESFIPQKLEGFTNLREDGNGPSPQKKSKQEDVSKSKVEATKLKELPLDEKQSEQVKSFMEDLEKEGKFQNMLDVMRKCLHIVCRLYAAFEWPQDLRLSFADLYLLWRQHFYLPNNQMQPHEEELDIIVRGCAAVIEGGFMETRGKFLKDDLFHLRWVLTMADDQRNHDTLGLHFYYFLNRNEVDRAIGYGKMVLDEYPADPNSIVTMLNRDYLEETVKSLQYSKNLPRVQAFFDGEEYDSVVQILSRTIDHQSPKEDIWYSQMFMLIDSLWHMERYADCFKRSISLIGHMADRCITDVDEDDVKEMDSVLTTLDCCVQAMDEAEFAALDEEVLSSLCSTLIVFMCRQIHKTAPPNMTPWVIFYDVLAVHEEKTAPVTPILNYLPKSINYLAAVHEYLGPNSLCTVGKGRILKLIIDVFVPLLLQEGKYTARIQDQLKKALDQALFCLYCHPSKKSKSKYLVDHGISNMALRWDMCGQLYSYVYPKKLPEFDDYRQNSISSDTEALLKRIHACVPEEYFLEERKAFVKRRFARRKAKFAPYQGDPSRAPPPSPAVPKDLFYLLGDYSFKNSEFKVGSQRKL